MGILREIEKRLETLFEGFFARTLPGGGVQPIELGKRMVRSMDEEQVKAVSGATFVPNVFRFALSKKDYVRIAQIEKTLRKELVAVAKRAGAAEKWQFVGPLEIHLEEDGSIKSGTFRVASEFVEGTKPEPVAGPQTQLIQMAMSADAELVQIGSSSRSWPLSKEALVLGRQKECDVVIGDPGVSRRHAEIRREGDEWVVIDLGSTNGTEINGKRMNRHRLAPGDRIVIGETTLEFRRP